MARWLHDGLRLPAKCLLDDEAVQSVQDPRAGPRGAEES